MRQAGAVQSSAIGLKTPRKPPASRPPKDSLCSSFEVLLASLAELPGLAALLAHCVRCGACIVRVRRDAGPFQSHPRWLVRQLQSGGTERGDALAEGGRRKHCRAAGPKRAASPPTPARRGFRDGSSFPGLSEHDRRATGRRNQDLQARPPRRRRRGSRPRRGRGRCPRRARRPARSPRPLPPAGRRARCQSR